MGIIGGEIYCGGQPPPKVFQNYAIKWVLLEGPAAGRYIVGWLALEDDILGTVYCFTTCPDYTNNSTEGESSRNVFLLHPHFVARTESGI